MPGTPLLLAFIRLRGFALRRETFFTAKQKEPCRPNAPAAQGYHQKPSRAKEDSPLLVAGPPKYLTFIHTEFMV